MGNKNVYSDIVDRAEYKLKFNQKTIKEQKLAFFMLNNCSKIYTQKLNIGLQNMNINIKEKNKKLYFNPFQITFLTNHLQTSCMNFDKLQTILFLHSKDSDKTKIREIFRDFEKMNQDKFQEYFNEILESISNYSDAINLYNFMLKHEKNQKKLDYKFHLSYREFKKIQRQELLGNMKKYLPKTEQFVKDIFKNTEQFQNQKKFSRALRDAMKKNGIIKLNPIELRRFMGYKFDSNMNESQQMLLNNCLDTSTY